MSSQGRVFSLVALAAVVASGVVVAGVLATRGHVPATAKPRAGHPPLALDFNVRTDAEARALTNAEQLYAHGQADRAAQLFARYRSLEAQVGAALAGWPDGSVERLQQLQADHPRSALVALHLGLALYWTHHDAEAGAAWQAARRDQPDTPYAVRATDLLHPQYAPGLPRFVPSFRQPLQIRVLPAAMQLAALRRAAAGSNVRLKLLYGVALQQLGRPRSAERQYAAAARLAPENAEARVAQAVGLFDKANPVRAFSRLGPLTRVFPRAQTVRFHLGLLLVWSGQVAAARKQFRLAQQQAPRAPLGREATRYLAVLARVGTS
ncbi:MAG: tetratricopeptide repeat protein [Gaiellaceae bacterium]